MADSGKAGINGAAVLAIGGGLLLSASAVKNVNLPELVRSLVAGRPITGQQAGSIAESEQAVSRDVAEAQSSAVTQQEAQGVATSIAGSAQGVAIVAAARKYLGIKYVFGGATPKGFDCSGLVTYVLHHDLGLSLPSNTHTVAAQFYVWSGAQTVSWDQMLPGDLVCWAGHIGIAVGGDQMIDAPHTGTVVKQQKIWRSPMPIIRRVKVQA